MHFDLFLYTRTLPLSVYSSLLPLTNSLINRQTERKIMSICFLLKYTENYINYEIPPKKCFYLNESNSNSNPNQFFHVGVQEFFALGNATLQRNNYFPS